MSRPGIHSFTCSSLCSVSRGSFRQLSSIDSLGTEETRSNLPGRVLIGHLQARLGRCTIRFADPAVDASPAMGRVSSPLTRKDRIRVAASCGRRNFPNGKASLKERRAELEERWPLHGLGARSEWVRSQCREAGSVEHNQKGTIGYGVAISPKKDRRDSVLGRGIAWWSHSNEGVLDGKG